MTLRIFTILTLLGFVLIRCSTGQGTKWRPDKSAVNKSRVEHFEYGGYSDTIYALIYGQVYELEKTLAGKDTLKPIPNVAIRAEQNGKVATTNNKGEFEIGLEKGIFSLMVLKRGYEPIQLKNYISDPDQVSSTEIVLVKGKEQRTFEIPTSAR